MTMSFASTRSPEAQQQQQNTPVCCKSVDEKDAVVTGGRIMGKQSLADSDRVTSNNTTSNDSSSDDQPQLVEEEGVEGSSNNIRMKQPLQVTPQATTATTFNSTTVNASSVAFSLYGDDSDNAQTLPDEFAKKLVAQIHRRLDQFLSNSPYIRNNTDLEQLPRFTPGHLNLGKVLAKGGFSNIIELNSFNNEECILQPASSEDVDEKDNSLSSLSQGEEPKGEYVIKCLSTKLALKKLPGATKDIVFEAHTLASLKHDHIVCLRGWSQDGVGGFQSSLRADGFFLILDRLGDTLFQRVFQWQNELKGRGSRSRSNSSNSSNRSNNGKKFGIMRKHVNYQRILRQQFQEKIQIAVDVSSALAYCHEKRIIHRDIKSANVAFDRNGRAKLIDFGLAVEIPTKVLDEPHRTYELTGNIGTARYMSPEVILEKPYNEKSDVHSFAVLCWEACAAKKPYSCLDAKKVKEHVSKWNERPKPYWSWPRRLRKIMKQGWARKQEDRPTMAEFHEALLKVQAKLPKA